MNGHFSVTDLPLSNHIDLKVNSINIFIIFVYTYMYVCVCSNMYVCAADHVPINDQLDGMRRLSR